MDSHTIGARIDLMCWRRAGSGIGLSRLVHQKGRDVAIETVETIVRQGGQIVVTGRGDHKFENALYQVGRHYRGRVAVEIG